MDEFDDFGYDEGSDVDNWEAEQCFQDLQAEAREEAREAAAEWDGEEDYPFDGQ